MELEEMRAFFTARADIYDAHMLEEVEGCREAYAELAQLLPKDCETLLDLGCGTGLELDGLFRLFPNLKVTGVDLTQTMLDKLLEKYPNKALTLICGDYCAVPFGQGLFDCALSVQTMHHFTHGQKTALYRKICAALKPDGVYIECDYMVTEQAEEDFYFSEYARLCKEQCLPDDVSVHYDTPCTIENQIHMLQTAGFKTVGQQFRKGNTTILSALKKQR